MSAAHTRSKVDKTVYQWYIREAKLIKFISVAHMGSKVDKAVYQWHICEVKSIKLYVSGVCARRFNSIVNGNACKNILIQLRNRVFCQVMVELHIRSFAYGKSI